MPKPQPESNQQSPKYQSSPEIDILGPALTEDFDSSMSSEDGNRDIDPDLKLKQISVIEKLPQTVQKFIAEIDRLHEDPTPEQTYLLDALSEEAKLLEASYDAEKIEEAYYRVYVLLLLITVCSGGAVAIALLSLASHLLQGDPAYISTHLIYLETTSRTDLAQIIGFGLLTAFSNRLRDKLEDGFFNLDNEQREKQEKRLLGFGKLLGLKTLGAEHAARNLCRAVRTIDLPKEELALRLELEHEEAVALANSQAQARKDRAAQNARNEQRQSEYQNFLAEIKQEAKKKHSDFDE